MSIDRTNESNALIKIRGHLVTCIDELVLETSNEQWALLDWPSHPNCGDSAIWLGTLDMLERSFGTKPAYVTRWDEYPEDLDRLMPEGPVFLHGGGNFGDTWKTVHDNRLHILREYRHRNIIQLPQSIKFSSTEYLEETARVIEKHPNFKLLVRDQSSFEMSQKMFDCDVRLCPDMAYGMSPITTRMEPEVDFLFLMRTDHEKSQTSPSGEVLSRYGSVTDWVNDRNLLSKFVKLLHMADKMFGTRRFTMPHFQKLFRMLASKKVQRAVSTLNRGRFVVTDRLHGHILSSLIGKPHLVYDNSYGKVTGYIETWPRDGFTQIAHTVTDLERYISDSGVQ